MRALVFSAVCVATLCAFATSADADFVELEPLGIIAERSTLVIRYGKVDENFALQIFFGGGLAASRNAGLVFEENISEGNHLNKAMLKLIEILNDPRTIQIKTSTLSSDIGLTVKQWVPAMQVKNF